MKNKKINLLINREDYQKIEKFFFLIRIFVGVLSVVFFLLIIFSLGFFTKQNNTKQSLLEQKKIILQSLKEKQADQAKITYLEKKYLSLKEFLKEDAYFLPYYNLLNSALSLSTQSAQLNSFEISKSREVKFSVIFTNFSELMNFFKFIESDRFLKNFENLVLKSFSTTTTDLNQEKNYELVFTGRFIPINENKN